VTAPRLVAAATLALLLAASPRAAQPASPVPDLVLYNGRLITIDRAFSIARPSPSRAIASSPSARAPPFERVRAHPLVTSISRAGPSSRA